MLGHALHALRVTPYHVGSSGGGGHWEEPRRLQNRGEPMAAAGTAASPWAGDGQSAVAAAAAGVIPAES